VLTRLNDLTFWVEIDGAGPPLLLLHGFTGSSRVWDDVRPDLMRSATVITLDLIGHGRSAAPADAARYSLERAAEDVLALLDWLGLLEVNLLGYSMGGRVALHFATRHPRRVRTLTMESASPGIEDPAQRQLRLESDNALAVRILEVGLEEFAAEWEQQPLLALGSHVSEIVRERQHALRLAHTPLGLANSLRGMGAGQQQPLWSRLAELNMPVTLIVGESDFRYRAIAVRMCAALPSAHLLVVQHAGHTVHVDAPAELVRIVKQVLAPADCTLSSN
jgi:2-succinyl-6-hydroxy-2,4-cyclohexadiene-1-carboxylate synthase